MKSNTEDVENIGGEFDTGDVAKHFRDNRRLKEIFKDNFKMGLVPVVFKYYNQYSYRFYDKKRCTKLDGKGVKINGICVPVYVRNLDLAHDREF